MFYIGCIMASTIRYCIEVEEYQIDYCDSFYRLCQDRQQHTI